MGFFDSLFGKKEVSGSAISPLPEICVKIKTGRIDGKKIFSGGKKKDWKEVVTHAKNWKTILENSGYIPDMKIERVTSGFSKEVHAGLIHRSSSLKTMKDIYGKHDDLISSSTLGTQQAPYYESDSPEGFNQEEVWMYGKYINDIIKGYQSSEQIVNDYTNEEIEVLKLGGCVLGTYKEKILIYYPYTSESVMAKILSEEIKPPEPKIYYSGSSNYSTNSMWGNSSLTPITISGAKTP